MKPPRNVCQASYLPVQMQLPAEGLASCRDGCSVCNRKSLRRVGPGTSILSPGRSVRPEKSVISRATDEFRWPAVDNVFWIGGRNRAIVSRDHEDRPAAGRLPDAMKPGTHGVRTYWIRGFMAFQLARGAGTVMLMVSVRPRSSFRMRGARALTRRHCVCSSMNAVSARYDLVRVVLE